MQGQGPKLTARGDVDLLIGMPPAGCSSELPYEDSAVRADHPTVGKRLSIEPHATPPHLEVALFDQPDDRVDKALARVGRAPPGRCAGVWSGWD
jgi:hypothetical protein